MDAAMEPSCATRRREGFFLVRGGVVSTVLERGPPGWQGVPPREGVHHDIARWSWDSTGRISMSRRFFGATRPPGSCPEDGPARLAVRPVRLSILGGAQAGSLAVLVGALSALTSEPTPKDQGSPTWSARTGHAMWVKAAAFSPDGR